MEIRDRKSAKWQPKANTFKSFKFSSDSGVTVNDSINMETEIDARLLNGNKCYCAVNELLKNKLLSVKTKIRLHKSF